MADHATLSRASRRRRSEPGWSRSSVGGVQIFPGLEAELTIKKLLLNAGGYRRIGEGDDDWLTSVGLGFVF